MSDDFDTFLNFERAKAGHTNEPAQIADYPEHVVETLRVFNRVWCPPPLAIPKKRQSSKFKQWINDLEELEDLCSTNARFELALKMATDVYQTKGYTFIVDSPLKLKNLIITALSEINRKKQQETVAEPDVVRKTDHQKTSKTFDDLRESLIEGD